MSTLAQIQSRYYRRTKTNSTSFPAADQVIALNNANEYALSLIQDKTDNFVPTSWTTTDLSTGTATPPFEAKFHKIISLHVEWEWAIENGLKSANGIDRQLQQVSREMQRFYSTRQYRIFTVTIASPGVFTRTKHGLENGERIILSTSGALPTGLSTNTWYFVKPTSDDEFRVSATLDGSDIDTSGTQSGTHWFGRENNPTISYESTNFL